jgi:hypothetical protein
VEVRVCVEVGAMTCKEGCDKRCFRACSKRADKPVRFVSDETRAKMSASLKAYWAEEHERQKRYFERLRAKEEQERKDRHSRGEYTAWELQRMAEEGVQPWRIMQC